MSEMHNSQYARSRDFALSGRASIADPTYTLNIALKQQCLRPFNESAIHLLELSCSSQ